SSRKTPMDIPSARVSRSRLWQEAALTAAQEYIFLRHLAPCRREVPPPQRARSGTEAPARPANRRDFLPPRCALRGSEKPSPRGLFHARPRPELEHPRQLPWRRTPACTESNFASGAR